MDNFNDEHFFYTPSQGNIYTMTVIQLANGSTKLLVASLKREIFCFEYQECPNGSLAPTTREISFTYIPNLAEIISLDAFNKSTKGNEFVIGITIIKNSNDSNSRLKTYLNIYSEWEETEEFNIENIAQSCLNVELNFIPYKLMHTHLVTWKDGEIVNNEIVFVLSGSDHQIHVYREQSSEHNYKEIDNKDFFPEFCKTPTPVVWIDIYYTEDFSERITSFATECGYVKLMRVDVKTNTIIYNFSTRFGNLVSEVCIYPEKRRNKVGKERSNEIEIIQNSTKERTKLNLIVVNSIHPAVIFHDVLEYGLTDYSTLPRLDCTNVQSCCEIADIDFDGEKEIIIGNTMAELLYYKKDKEKSWCLEGVKKMAAPILALKYIDMRCDGIKDLVVLSVKGVHVLQHDLSYVEQVLIGKIKKLQIELIDGEAEDAEVAEEAEESV